MPSHKDEALAHAAWLRDAMEATKQAAVHAESYQPLDGFDMQVPRNDRAVSFHEKNSGPNASLNDAVMDALRWHIPPDELRELESGVRVAKLEREIEMLKLELRRSNEQIATWRDIALRPKSDESDEDRDIA